MGRSGDPYENDERSARSYKRAERTYRSSRASGGDLSDRAAKRASAMSGPDASTSRSTRASYRRSTSASSSRNPRARRDAALYGGRATDDPVNSAGLPKAQRPRISNASREMRNVDLVSVRGSKSAGGSSAREDSPSARTKRTLGSGSKRTEPSASGSSRSASHSRASAYSQDIAESSVAYGCSKASKEKGSHAKKQKKRGGRKATLAENTRSRSNRRKLGVVVAILCAILVVALAVGVFAFFRTTDSNLALADSNAAEALVAGKDGEPYYVLCVADMDDRATKAVESESEGYMLVRVDAPGKKLTFITVPSILTYKMSDGVSHPLYEAKDVGGDAELVRAVSALCGIDVNHFISTNSEHLINIVDMMGGIQLNIAEEIDDPNAGNEVIFAGEQTLSGKQVITYLRATNVLGGFDTTVANRVAFTTEVLNAALSSSGLGLANLVGDASLYIETDMSTSDLLSLGDALKPSEDLVIYSCIVPYYETRGSSTDDVVFQVSSNSWDGIRELVKSGQNPDMTDESISNVVPGDVTVEVRNGTQMTGAGAKLGEILSGYGYNVIGVGNVTDAITYPETLIVFTDSSYEGAAKAIASQIGSGRVVNGGDYYSSEAGVIAIIGADYMPAV